MKIHSGVSGKAKWLLIFLGAMACQKNPPTAPEPVVRLPAKLSKAASSRTVFGPETFIRNAGSPITEIRQFGAAGPSSTARLILLNGDGRGNRVTSASVRLNGTEIFGPDRFKSKTDTLRSVVDLAAENTLEVRIAGKPGSFIVISIERPVTLRLLFQDGFENIASGDYPDENGWRNVYSGVESYVTDEKAFTGNRGFKLVGQPYWARTEMVPIPNVSHIRYEARLFIPSPANSYPHVGLFNPALSTWGYQFPTVRFDRIEWNVYAYGLSYGVPDERLDIGDFATDQWIHVEVDADFAARRMSVWINGTQAAESLVMNTRSDYTAFHFATGGYNEPGTSVLYVDDVAVYEVESGGLLAVSE
jgi:hypothetical protein